jgi:hypothetical protein
LNKIAIVFHRNTSDHEKVDWIVASEIGLFNVSKLTHCADEGTNVHASSVKHESMPLRKSTDSAADEEFIPQ